MNACSTPVLSYGAFSDRIHRAAGPSRTPVNGSVELTYRCNLRCEHCYIPHRSDEGELTPDEWKRVIDEVAEAGCLFLLITGGEPFLRRDAIDIYLHAKRSGLLVTVFTNGTTITPGIVETLAEYPPFSVEVTLYGASPQTYERVTGVAGAYRAAVRGVRLLSEARLPLAIKTVVLRLNREDLPRIEAMAEEIGARFRFDTTVHPRLDGNRAPLPVRLSPEEIVALDKASPDRLRELERLHRRFGGFPDPSRLFQCGAGRNSFHVDPFGRLMLCESVSAFGYDLRRASFADGWRGYVEKVLSMEASRRTRCHRCALYSLCGQCPAWSLMENGTLDDPVEYLCDITAARAEAMGLAERPPGWNPEKRRARSPANHACACGADCCGHEAATGTCCREMHESVESVLPLLPERNTARS